MHYDESLLHALQFGVEPDPAIISSFIAQGFPNFQKLQTVAKQYQGVAWFKQLLIKISDHSKATSKFMLMY